MNVSSRRQNIRTEDQEENLDERSKENEIILKHRKGTFRKCGTLSKDQIF